MPGRPESRHGIAAIILMTAVMLADAGLIFAETVTHQYDELNRLIKSEYSDGTTLIYDYDRIGNRTVKKKLYRPHTLSVTATGEGSGTITSQPARITCGSACSEKFSEGTQITLTATPGAGSAFVQWTGGCIGTGPCILTLTADTAVSAIFHPSGCTNLPVRIGTTSYSSLQAAYNAATSGAVIKSQNVTLVGDLTINRSAVTTVTLDGGYHCDFASKSGSTIMRGSITTSAGATTIKDLIVQQ